MQDGKVSRIQGAFRPAGGEGELRAQHQQGGGGGLPVRRQPQDRRLLAQVQLRVVSASESFRAWANAALFFFFADFCRLFSGGRRIVVTGSGFDLIQRATLKVLPTADDFSSDNATVEVGVARASILIFPHQSSVLTTAH